MLRACERRGIQPVVAYGPSWRDRGLPPLPDGARVVFVESESSAEAVLTALARTDLATDALVAVMTNNEYNLVNASVVASVLGSRSVAPETAVRFRDKQVQKEIIRSHGIPTARSVVVEDLLDTSNLTLPFERAVLKPVAGAATRMTKLVRSIDELRAISKRYQRHRAVPRTCLLEEFQPGDEWLLDGVVHSGQVCFLSVAEYAVPCLETVRSNGALRMRRFDPDTEHSVFALVDPIVRAAIKALGLQDGVFHMELFHHEGKLSFGECGARRGGGLVHEEVEYKWGVDLGDAAVMTATGREPDIQPKIRPEVVGSLYLVAGAGLLYAAPTEAEIMTRQGVQHVEMEYPIGSTLVPASDTTSRVGMALLASESVKAFHAQADEVSNWFAEKTHLIPPDLTNRELAAMQPQLAIARNGRAQSYV